MQPAGSKTARSFHCRPSRVPASCRLAVVPLVLSAPISGLCADSRSPKSHAGLSHLVFSLPTAYGRFERFPGLRRLIFPRYSDAYLISLINFVAGQPWFTPCARLIKVPCLHSIRVPWGLTITNQLAGSSPWVRTALRALQRAHCRCQAQPVPLQHVTTPSSSSGRVAVFGCASH